MGYFKEKLIEQMGHDLDDPFRFLRAMARKAERTQQNADWWRQESDHVSEVVQAMNEKSTFIRDASA